jgi:hypothetical protein
MSSRNFIRARTEFQVWDAIQIIISAIKELTLLDTKNSIAILRELTQLLKQRFQVSLKSNEENSLIEFELFGLKYVIRFNFTDKKLHYRVECGGIIDSGVIVFINYKLLLKCASEADSYPRLLSLFEEEIRTYDQNLKINSSSYGRCSFRFKLNSDLYLLQINLGSEEVEISLERNGTKIKRDVIHTSFDTFFESSQRTKTLKPLQLFTKSCESLRRDKDLWFEHLVNCFIYTVRPEEPNKLGDENLEEIAERTAVLISASLDTLRTYDVSRFQYDIKDEKVIFNFIREDDLCCKATLKRKKRKEGICKWNYKINSFDGSEEKGRIVLQC